MTIRTNVNLNAASDLLGFATDGCSQASHTAVDCVLELIGETVDELRKQLVAMGIPVDNCDGIREVEALIYDWARRAKPEAFEAAELDGIKWNS